MGTGADGVSTVPGEPRILGLFDHNGILSRADRLRGRDPVAGPYRVDLLDDVGYELRTMLPAQGRIHRKLRDVVEHRSGLDVDMALRGVPEAFKADAVFAMFERRALLVSQLRRRGIPPYSSRPFWAISCWWAEELRRGDGAFRQRVRKAMEGIDGLIVFSQNQRAIFASAGIPSAKVHPVDFGVDPEFYSPPRSTVERRFQVLAAGVDRGRDFDSLVAAARFLPEARFDIFTQPGRIKGVLPHNVSVHAPVDITTHRDNLRSAELVVVPTHDLAYPTGQSVLLEASSCGTCVAVTHTDALSQYISDGETALAMPLHDPEGMASVIRAALEDETLRARIGAKARQGVLEHFTFRAMWAEIGRLVTARGR